MNPQDQINLHTNAGKVANDTIAQLYGEMIRTKTSPEYNSLEDLAKDFSKAVEVLRGTLSSLPAKSKVIS